MIKVTSYNWMTKTKITNGCAGQISAVTFVQRAAQKPSSKICPVSQALGTKMKIIVLFIISFLVSACSAYKVLPKDMSSRQSEVILVGSVKLVTDYPEGNGEQWLSEALVRQKLSHEVISSDREETADYVLNLESKYSGRCFSEPMLTAITLGIIPSVGCAEIGYKIDLTDGSNRLLVSADSRREVTTVFGIAAWFLLLSPSWVGEKGVTEYEASSIVKELSKI